MSDEATPPIAAGDEAVPPPADAGKSTTPEGQVQTDPPADGDGSAFDDESADAPPDKPSRSKERRERHKAYLDQLRRSEEDARRRLERVTRAADADAEPKETDYADPIEYAAAKAVWASGKRSVAREAEAATDDQHAVLRERSRVLAQEFEDQKAEARMRYADFDAVVNNGSVEIRPHVAQLVLESEISAELAYAIASNPARAAALSRMTPIEAARAIGRIEAGISRPRPRVETQAPEPIRTVQSRSSPGKSPESMSYVEYRKWRQGATT
jgi:hypothetical protein